MNKLDFTTEISKLETFFNLKLNKSDVINAWFLKLEKYSASSFSKAVDHIINTCTKTKPSFGELLQATQMFYDKEPKAKPISVYKITQGLAPMTPQKRVFVHEMLSELNKAFQIKDKAQRGIQMTGLKEVWTSGYTNLPGYKSQEQCLVMARNEQFEELEKLGV